MFTYLLEIFENKLAYISLLSSWKINQMVLISLQELSNTGIEIELTHSNQGLVIFLFFSMVHSEM